MDVLVEEDENIVSPLSGTRDEADLLVTEQAIKLFRLCDKKGKGFVVKEDLVQMRELVPGMSSSAIESFFDNIVVSKSNFLTEGQFVDGIKPILLKSERDANNKDVRSTGSLSGSEPDVRAESNTYEGRNSVNNIQDYLAIPDVSDPDTHASAVKKGTKDTTAESISAFSGSLKDELSAAKIGEKEKELLQKEEENFTKAEVDYPFCVENKIIEPPCTESKTMDVRQTLKLNDLRKRETCSQLDLRRNLYLPDIKQSPGSRSLADELREVGVTNPDAPPSEPRPDYSPERIFKVVFVGDSAVGKTCFLHRFCHNRFKPLFNATIGVDFTVKTIRLQNRVVAVQLWDTAGQERFRSITKQYFRKADGVILMYDVTSEQSFLNVRNWIDSVKAGVDENCVMCLVGNKVDLFANDHARALTFKHGQKLAEEFGMLFFETSAFTGYNVNDCMKAVAMRLQEREDEDLQEALKLDMGVQGKQRSWCCL